MRDTHQYLPCSNPTAEPSSYRYRPGLATWLTRSADPRTLPVGSLADLCDPGSLTNTLTQTERILAVAITSGMYQMADIALTYQLTGPSSDAAHPADRLQTNNFRPNRSAPSNPTYDTTWAAAVTRTHSACTQTRSITESPRSSVAIPDGSRPLPRSPRR